MDVENEIGRQLVHSASVKTFGFKENGDDTLVKSRPLAAVLGNNVTTVSKLIEVEKMPGIILTKTKESVEAFIDVVDNNVITCVTNSQRQTNDIYVMYRQFMIKNIRGSLSTSWVRQEV